MKRILTLTIMCVFAFAHHNLNAQCGTSVTGTCYSTLNTLEPILVDICPDLGTETVTFTFTAGSIETCCDEIVVYSGAFGSGTGGTEIYNAAQPSGDMTGLIFTGNAAGECLSIYINSDVSVTCASLAGAAPAGDITCAAPPPPAPSGGETCADVAPLCSGSPVVFDGTGGATDVATAEPGIDLGCLGSGPRPSWFYIEVETAGNFDLNLDPVPAASVDYDFALYGPFADLATAQGACGAGLGAPLDCSFAGGTAPETPSIAGALVGEVYVLLVSKFGAAAAEFQLSEAGTTTGTTNCSIVSCPITQDFTAPASVCAGEAVNFTSGGACAGLNGPNPVTDYVVDLYYYDDGVGSFEAPGGYTVDVSSVTETTDAADATANLDGFDNKNPDLTLVGFDFTCASAPADAAGWINNTCAPYTVTYFTVAIGPGSDTDGDGELEYAPDCTVERYDVIVYPAALTVVVTDDGTTCGTPTVELRNAAGTACETLTGAACVADGDAFNYDFSATGTVTGLAGAPAGCVLPTLTGTITCGGCTAPCDAVTPVWD